MQSNTPASRSIGKLERTSTRKESDFRKSLRHTPPISFGSGSDEISIIGVRNQALDNMSDDSVFVQISPTSSPSIIPTTIGMVTDQSKKISNGKKPGRYALYSDGGIAVCRICHSSEESCPFSNGEPLISPCRCRGSTGLYHRTCLERWLSVANKDKCEICKFQYSVQKEQKGLCEFLAKPGNKSIRRHIISDFICFLILTPTAFIGAWLCIGGAVSRSARTTWTDPSERVQVPTLLALATFLVMTYLIWGIICIRYHVSVWRRWRVRNYRIRLLDSDEAKRKRRKVSNLKKDMNKNIWIRTRHATPRQNNGANEERASTRTSRSTTSRGTTYSTPWHRTALRPNQITPSPYFASPELGPMSIFEPRSSAPHFEEIAL